MRNYCLEEGRAKGVTGFTMLDDVYLHRSSYWFPMPMAWPARLVRGDAGLSEVIFVYHFSVTLI